MTKRKFINLALGLAVAISPLAVVMACTNSSKDETVNQTKPTTIKQNKFLASDFNFNQPIDEVQKLINEEWILAKKQLLLNSSDQLTNTNQILNLNVSKNQAVLNVSFQLASGSYIDQNSQVGSQPSPAFKFTIINFISNSQPDLPPTIDLDLIISQATFDVENKASLKPSQVQTEQLKWNQQANQSNVNFKVISLLPDDQSGKLGFQVEFSQKNLPSNLKSLSVQPSEDQAVSGFITSPPVAGDQTILDQEIDRLTQAVDQVINVSKLTTVEITNYINNPASFKQHLNNLDEPKFSYDIVKFSVNEQSLLSIALFVKYQSATKVFNLTKQIEVIKVDFNDPQWLQTAEKNRLNKLIKNSIFLKATFNEQEISNWRQNPNQVLNHLFNFVSTFGFHYQVQGLNFSTPNPQNQAKLTFKIAAMFWKNPAKPIVISDQFSFDITIIKDQIDEIKPPVPTPVGWLISPSNQATVDPQDPNQFLLTIDLNNDQQLDFANYENANAEKSDQLMMTIFNQAKDKFIKITGDLPADWNWNHYVTPMFWEEIRDQQSRLIGYQYIFQFDYVNSKNLDDWFQITTTITNGYNSGTTAGKPNPDQVWNNLKTKFSNLITTQAIDDDKLHLDWSGNGIMGFAQLGYENFSKSDHFSNFLNFSPTEFRIENQHLVNVKVKDESINYLTNTINFTWVLEGLNNSNLGIDLSSYRKEFANQTIQYKPKDKWSDAINFNDQDPQLKISNSISLNNILDRFGLSNKFVSETILKDKFKQFGTNWTWKARELVNYVCFTFFQGFNDGADAINMGIVGIDPNTTPLNKNPQKYQIVLKAKLNANAQGTYLPYLQQFGSAIGASARTWQSGEIIEIRLDVNSIPETPDVVKNANEILPGLSPGNVLGTGQGAEQAYLNSSPRNDIYSIALGSNLLNIKVNDQLYVTNLSANHRFIAFNFLSRYDFKDPLNPEPTPETGWTSGNF